MSLIQYLHDTWVAIIHGISKPVPILMALFDGTLPFSTIFYDNRKTSQSSIATQEKPQLDGRMDQWELELEPEIDIPALGDDIPLHEKFEKLDRFNFNIDMQSKRAMLLATDHAHKVLVFGFLAFVVMLWLIYLRKQHVASKKAKSEPTEEFKKLLMGANFDANKWEAEGKDETQTEKQIEVPLETQTDTPPDSQTDTKPESVSRAIPTKQRMTPNRSSLDDIVMIDSVLETDANGDADTSIQDVEMGDAEGIATRSESVMSVDMADDASDVAAGSSFTMLPLAKDLDFTEDAPVALAGGVAVLSLENDDAGINSPRKRPVRRIPQPLRRERKRFLEKDSGEGDENGEDGESDEGREVGEDIPMALEASPDLAPPTA